MMSLNNKHKGKPNEKEKSVHKELEDKFEQEKKLLEKRCKEKHDRCLLERYTYLKTRQSASMRS
jgi:hypothetical protein